MIIEDIKVLGKTSRMKIVLSDGTVFPLYKGELKKYNIEAGTELSKNEYDKILEETLIPRAKERASHILEKADKTEGELRKKLKENYYPEKAIDEAVSMLKEYHYIDDSEYAKSYIRTYESSKSKKVIKLKLLEKGIDRDTIDLALSEEFSTGETELIKRLLEKRHYIKEEADRKEKEKTIRYLMGRGFSYDSFSDLV